MKKVIILNTLIFLSLISFAQTLDYGHVSYNENRPSNSPPPSDYYRVQAELEAYKQAQRKIEYEEKQSKAFDCFNSKDYSGCIYYYNQCRKLGWYNSSFDYIAGLSYYKIGNKSKAKKYLKLSSKRGYYDAQKKLNELFK